MVDIVRAKKLQKVQQEVPKKKFIVHEGVNS